MHVYLLGGFVMCRYTEYMGRLLRESDAKNCCNEDKVQDDWQPGGPFAHLEALFSLDNHLEWVQS